MAPLVCLPLPEVTASYPSRLLHFHWPALGATNRQMMEVDPLSPRLPVAEESDIVSRLLDAVNAPAYMLLS